MWEGKKEGAWDLRMSCTRAGGRTRKSSRGCPFGFDLQGAGYVIRWLQLPVLYSKNQMRAEPRQPRLAQCTLDGVHPLGQAHLRP